MSKQKYIENIYEAISKAIEAGYEIDFYIYGDKMMTIHDNNSMCVEIELNKEEE